MTSSEVDLNLNVLSKLELVNGSVKFGIVYKRLEKKFFKSDYYFVSIRNLKKFRASVESQNRVLQEALMEPINIKFIKALIVIELNDDMEAIQRRQSGEI